MKSTTQSMLPFIIFFSILNITTVIKSAPASDSSLVISCGSNGGTDSSGRKWESDSKYLIASSNNNNSAATTQYQDPSLPSTIPYMSARIFTSPSTYQFPVSPTTRFFLRLHFYPSSYASSDPKDAYFDVVANEFTLLRNFSAFITAKAITQAYFIKEFSLAPLQSGKLNITFTPFAQHGGTGTGTSSYAFINGIEIIPIPDSNMFQSATFVPNGQFYEVGNNSLQTMFRLNVGGQSIPPNKDSGLSRTWYDDSTYLYGAADGVTYVADKDVKIQYPSGMSKEIAPLDVYGTARSMGPNATLNLNYNLSWEFLVDANFTYVVRFHFCELDLTKINQRVFDIFINNQTAQAAADVIAWAGSKGVPVYKDFATYVMDGAGDDEQLVVALHPSVAAKPEYYDAILNGLEIFKVNDSDGNLAGPNPTPSQMLLDAEGDTGKKFKPSKHNHAQAIGGAVGAGIVVIVVVCIFFVYRLKKRNGYGNGFVVCNWIPLHGSSHKSTTVTGKSSDGGNSNLSSLTQGLCQHFSLAEIRHATKNFDESQVIGVGGFGKVYEGVIDGGTKVAIKRSNPSSKQGVVEFETEIKMLSRLRHQHLVSLIGFCDENGEMILVYDYMANGTVREHLYKTNKPALSWTKRLEICIGAAKGLHYLHTGAKHTIIHRDVKTTNILLDENWVAKVSDFGLSKTGANLNQTHVTTMVKGSFGYLDPEYFRRQQLTEKSDVYSFGVVLLEVLCARPPLDQSLPKEQVSLADWALLSLKKGTLEDIIDPLLKGKINPHCLKTFVETAEKCVADCGLDRPSMNDVLWKLEFALQLQENPNGGKDAAKEKANNAYASHNSTSDIEEGIAGSEVDDSSSSAIYSQIVNPRGR
ncbi:hypothetical protein RIF29_07079 [Crotalaria pallida]|uniref:non-specific serine/threonine protein kinase n=1 Tax=Crotalaria pallida TaxID=3830 RepID=A0AAN9J447_CROPI